MNYCFDQVAIYSTRIMLLLLDTYCDGWRIATFTYISAFIYVCINFFVHLCCFL